MQPDQAKFLGLIMRLATDDRVPEELRNEIFAWINSFSKEAPPKPHAKA